MAITREFPWQYQGIRFGKTRDFYLTEYKRPEKGAAIAAAEFLQTNFPDRTGFSPRNVRQMRWQEMSESGIWSRRYAVDGQKHSY